MINRKLAPVQTLRQIHTNMMTAVRSGGGLITDIFFCPHTPEDGCPCRKPKPGLVLTARDKYDIELSSSFMIGDSAKDIECARRAGCAAAVLVQTGNGKAAVGELRARGILPDHVAGNLAAAADWIISRMRDPGNR